MPARSWYPFIVLIYHIILIKASLIQVDKLLQGEIFSLINL